MTSVDPVPTYESPTARRVLRSTVAAALVAMAILVTIVLPAEYGVDPTGIGRLLGLKEMGEIKMTLAREEAGHAATEAAAASAATAGDSARAIASAPIAAASPDSIVRSDSTQIVLLPNEGKEIKLAMRKDARVSFSWSTNRGVVNYDTHGDSPTLKYHGYQKGSAASVDEAVLTAAFDGKHGWYWRNRTTDTITVTLRTKGDYQELIRM